MKIEQHETNAYSVKIYISGPLQVIEQVCREYVSEVGLCVNVVPTKFIYTGGEETGATIELINYARFPQDRGSIWNHAEALADNIISAACQGSYTIMDDVTSFYYSRRDALGKSK